MRILTSALLASLVLACTPRSTGEQLSVLEPLESDERITEAPRIEFAPRRPLVHMNIVARHPLPDESYLVTLELSPSVPVRLSTRDESMYGLRVLADAYTEGYRDGRWYTIYEQFGGHGERSESLMPPDKRRVQVAIRPASAADASLFRVTHEDGFVSAPIAFDVVADRAAGHFEQATATASRALVRDLEARGFTGAALSREEPLQALGERLLATLQRSLLGDRCDTAEFESALARRGLSVYAVGNRASLMDADVDCADDESLGLALDVAERSSPAQLREQAATVTIEDGYLEIEVRGALYVGYEPGWRRGMPTIAQAREVARRLERDLDRGLLGTRRGAQR